MARTVYVEGRYVPYAEAGVHVEDRGFQFADAVYEVCEVLRGALVDETRHFARLERSLGALSIPAPMSRAALRHVVHETVRRNRVRNGSVYIQVSRGACPRDLAFPGAGVAPTLVVIARHGHPGRTAATAAKGIAVTTVPDIRWGRSDIKTVMLLPACLAKAAAHAEGAREAWLVAADGTITEGASSTAWIVTHDGTLVTRGLSAAILPGVTRATLIDLLVRDRIGFEERAFTVAEAKAAREAFVTSASQTVMPVVVIDRQPVADGRPGPIAARLRQHFHQVAELSVVRADPISPTG